ncbi:MAG: hypothetical protein GY866_33850 [Proteobacteria bacterium]|nr:hypothetical protein [Pseudomonadota bacterium]
MKTERGKNDRKTAEPVLDGMTRVSEKAEARKNSGKSDIIVDWQAALETYFVLVRKHLVDSPGKLLPVQIDDQKEWEFYLDVQTKLDLPPDTHAVLITPSASNSMFSALNQEFDAEFETPSNADSYSLLISDCRDYDTIMQVSLPGPESVGIDVYDNGSHLADYSYDTLEECLAEMSNVVWIFFKPKDKWADRQIKTYTENWFAKSTDILNMERVNFRGEFSYLHHPELLNLTVLEAIFELVRATVPFEYDSIETAIEITNDTNQDMEFGDPFVTVEGIEQGDIAESQVLLNQLAMAIDMQLDLMDYLEGMEFPDRLSTEYTSTFNETAKALFESITGRPCPESLRVF